MPDRPDVPDAWIERLDSIILALPDAYQQDAWTGVRWRVGQATIAHIFGGEDGQFRITMRAEEAELAAFENLGPPYFAAQWGSNVVGLLIDDTTDWTELAELLTDSYCLLAPPSLAARVQRPEPGR